MSEKLIEELLVEVLEGVTSSATLILFNDDVNTFDHVIDCLVRICKHEELQAEQCAFLVHFKGKCDVKHGEKADLMGMCKALLDEGLSATIDE